jgi:hypothetical protein
MHIRVCESMTWSIAMNFFTIEQVIVNLYRKVVSEQRKGGARIGWETSN